MTRFHKIDHDHALRACQEAWELNAAAYQQDITILNRAAGSYAAGTTENIQRWVFDTALKRVQESINEATGKQIYFHP